MSESLERKSRAKEFSKGLVATLPLSLPLVLGAATGIGNYIKSGNADQGMAGFIAGTLIYGFFSAVIYVGSNASGD